MAKGSGRKSLIDAGERYNAARRFIEGESVGVLAKLYEVSKPTIYLWVNKFKADALATAARDPTLAIDTTSMSRGELIATIRALEQERLDLQQKLVRRMIKIGEI